MKIGDALYATVTAVTKGWTRVQQKTLRDQVRSRRAQERYLRGTRQEPSIKDVAFDVMADAYQKASGNGRYPAHARQIMYQARPLILAGTDKPLGKDFDQYFTQTLLPEYRRRHLDTTAAWDVVYDARGHLEEPHTAQVVSLGTLDVRAYLASARNGSSGDGATITPISLRYPTTGPQGRYRNVLFLEKEGFNDLLDAARIAQRFDLAIMSTKGYSSTAARTLMECLSRQRAQRHAAADRRGGRGRLERLEFVRTADVSMDQRRAWTAPAVGQHPDQQLLLRGSVGPDRSQGTGGGVERVARPHHRRRSHPGDGSASVTT